MAKKKNSKKNVPQSSKSAASSKSPNKLQQFFKTYWQERSPVLRFLVGFIGCIILFYMIYYSPLYRDYIADHLLSFQASLGSGLLNLIGQGTTASHESITNGTFSVDIAKGCDGIEATALFIFAILVFPIAFKRKIPGLLAGVGVLFVVNIIRIAGLFLVGLYWNSAFEFMHLHGGLVLFTIAAIILWVVWADWALKKEKELAVSSGQ